MRQQNNFAVALVVLASAASAAIVSDSYWEDNHDLSNASVGLEIVDGIVSGSSDALTQRIHSTWTAVGHPTDYMSKHNVQRVITVFPESTFNSWSSSKNAIYTYDSFLKAVAKFPAFCNESNGSAYSSENDFCKRELAALFAHMYYSSNGMQDLKDPACANSIAPECRFKSNLPSPESSMFYARGPMGLKGDKEYAAFSKAFYEGFDRSAELLNNPNNVSDDGYVGFASALWKHMVPRKAEPSMHNVMSGFFVPNAADLQAGHSAGFGTTIQLMDKSLCSSGVDSTGATSRKSLFLSYQLDLNLTAETQNLSCKNTWSTFAWGGSSNKLQYFSAPRWNDDKCQIVGWETPYNAMDRDEYKRCVCIEENKQSDPSCQQAENIPDPTPGPEPAPTPSGPTPLEELLAMILEVQGTPHYSDTDLSNTTWQMDETLDYIEEKLFNIEQAFIQAGYMQ